MAFPYPPSISTSEPIKKTAIPVINRPRLKHTPVAVALRETGNSSGMYIDSAPWLIPKNMVMNAIWR